MDVLLKSRAKVEQWKAFYSLLAIFQSFWHIQSLLRSTLPFATVMITREIANEYFQNDETAQLYGI